ncbi:MAG: hypothetical protein IJR90_09430 [Clostridia bacterium]|nr:hypothetical protein [Clostridia bacterium]
MLKFLKENSYNIVRLFLSQIALAVFGLVMTIFTQNMSDMVYLTVGIFCVVFYVYLIYIIVHDIGSKDKPAVDAGRAEPQYLKGLWLGLAANALNIICGIMIFAFGFGLVYQQPARVLNEAGEQIELYFRIEGTGTSEDGKIMTDVEVYTDTGDDIYVYDNGLREAKVRSPRGGNSTLEPCDKEGNEYRLFSRSGDQVSVIAKGGSVPAVENWASDLYGVPKVIATFTQSMYKAVHYELFGNADWFFLVMPLPTILACALAYFLGVKGKRILFFLPELKDPRRKREGR